MADSRRAADRHKFTFPYSIANLNLADPKQAEANASILDDALAYLYSLIGGRGLDVANLSPVAQEDLTARDTDWTKAQVNPALSWTTNTTIQGCGVKRHGDSLWYFVQMGFSGAPDAGSLTIGLPDGLEVREALSLQAITGILNHAYGQRGHINDVSLSSIRGLLYAFYDADLNRFIVYYQSASSSVSLISRTVPITLAANDTLSILIGPVPIKGWERTA